MHGKYSLFYRALVLLDRKLFNSAHTFSFYSSTVLPPLPSSSFSSPYPEDTGSRLKKKKGGGGTLFDSSLRPPSSVLRRRFRRRSPQPQPRKRRKEAPAKGGGGGGGESARVKVEEEEDGEGGGGGGGSVEDEEGKEEGCCCSRKRKKKVWRAAFGRSLWLLAGAGGRARSKNLPPLFCRWLWRPPRITRPSLPKKEREGREKV